MQEMSIVELAEACLQNSVLRHGRIAYQAAQARFEAHLPFLEAA